MPKIISSTDLVVHMNVSQLEALRQSCKRLAEVCGIKEPIEVNSADEIISCLSSLIENYATHKNAERQSTLDDSHEVSAELENIERLKKRFIRNVSHELRTPLASIDGFARVLLRMESPELHSLNAPMGEIIPPDTRRRFLSIISNEAQRLGKLIEDVLNLSEIEGHSAPQQAPALFTARELFHDAIRAVSPDLKINVKLQLSPELNGPSIYADRDATLEVCRQLLCNAQKFSGGQSIIMGAEPATISTDKAPRAGGRPLPSEVKSATRIFVKDRGIVIPKDEINNLFQKFYRVERPGFSVPGTGVGLAICRALVLQNNGQIWAESLEGAGSTFYVLLPDSPPAAK